MQTYSEIFWRVLYTSGKKRQNKIDVTVLFVTGFANTLWLEFTVVNLTSPHTALSWCTGVAAAHNLPVLPSHRHNGCPGLCLGTSLRCSLHSYTEGCQLLQGPQQELKCVNTSALSFSVVVSSFNSQGLNKVTSTTHKYQVRNLQLATTFAF